MTDKTKLLIKQTLFIVLLVIFTLVFITELLRYIYTIQSVWDSMTDTEYPSTIKNVEFYFSNLILVLIALIILFISFAAIWLLKIVRLFRPDYKEVNQLNRTLLFVLFIIWAIVCIAFYSYASYFSIQGIIESVNMYASSNPEVFESTLSGNIQSLVTYTIFFVSFLVIYIPTLHNLLSSIVKHRIDVPSV